MQAVPMIDLYCDACESKAYETIKLPVSLKSALQASISLWIES
jgi:hypothetical protein